MTAVHQFVHSYVDHDATSAHARHLQRVITSMGIESAVYAGEWRGEKSKATFFRDFRGGDPKSTWLLYHLSTASPMAAYLNDRPEHIAMSYHNITPHQFMAAWEPQVAPELEIARKQLQSMRGKTEFAVAASEYSRSELQELGFRTPRVAPILFDPNDFASVRDENTLARLQNAKSAGGADWLFVGRITPHKCQHQIIQAFAMYRNAYDRNARLHLVGGISSHHYLVVLQQYIDRLDLNDAVFITKNVSDAVMGAYYDAADVFVCLSEHEGFGVPLLEAMFHGVPVIAYDAAAVGETVAGGGLMLAEKSPSLIAAAVHNVIGTPEVRDAVRRAGHQRLESFEMKAVEDTWRRLIEEMVAPS